jgi:dTDP-4-dehydrorhamnose reductase
LRKLLITGGSGDLGRPLSQRAARAGYDVSVTYLDHLERIRAGKPVQVDLCDRPAVKSILESLKPDVIIHTALNQGLARPREQIAVAGRNLREFSPQHTRLIYLSTDMIFDGARAPYDEDALPEPLSDYGRGKAEAEAYGDTVVRTSLIYDFEAGNKQTDWLLETVRIGQRCRLFYDEFRSPIWAVNLADHLLELAESAFRGIINIAGPKPMSRLDLGQGLLTVLGYDPESNVEAVSQVGSGRPRDLTLDVRKARQILKTPLLSLEEAVSQWTAQRGEQHDQSG